MKIVVTAIALAFATSAAAQTAPTAPAAPQHGGHAQHQGMTGGAHSAPAAPHQASAAGQHQGHSMASGCCADRNNNGVMDCCENMAAGSGGTARPGAPAQPQPGPSQNHQNH